MVYCLTCRKNHEPSEAKLLPILMKKNKAGDQSSYMICTKCMGVSTFTVQKETPKEAIFQEIKAKEIGDDFIYGMAHAFHTNERIQFMTERLKFLQKRSVLVYEPLTEADWERYVSTSGFDPDKMFSEDEEDEETMENHFESNEETLEDEPLWMVYADPTDLYHASLMERQPRYFRIFDIFTKNCEAIYYHLPNEFARCGLWIHDSTTMPYNLNIWDAYEQKVLSYHSFSKVKKEELWIEYPNSVRKKVLEEYLTFIQKQMDKKTKVRTR